MQDEKNGHTISGWVTYWRLMRYLKPYLVIFIISILGFVAYAATQPMLAAMMELFIDGLEGRDFDFVKWLPNQEGVLGGLLVALGGGDWYSITEGLKVAYLVPVLEAHQRTAAK